MLTLILTSTIAAGTPALLQVDSALEERLRNNEVVVDVIADGSVIAGSIVAVVDASVAAVWSRVADFEGQQRWIPNMKKARVLDRQGDVATCSAVTDTPWPIKNRTWTIQVHYRTDTLAGVDVHIAQWAYVKDSGNMKENSGYWILRSWGPDGSQTLARYAFEADAGLKVPDFIEKWATKRMLPRIIENLRSEVTQ